MSPTPSSQSALNPFSKLPITFIPNKGQANRAISFFTHGYGWVCQFGTTEVFFSYVENETHEKVQELSSSLEFGLRKEIKTSQGVTLALRFINANPDVQIEARCEENGKYNYFIGNSPDEWRTNISSYREVVYRDMWNGIDVVFRGVDGKIKYEFVIHPGATVEDIQWDRCKPADENSVGWFFV